MTEQVADYQEFIDQGFIAIKRLPSGELVGIRKFLFTYGLCNGVNLRDMYKHRFCFENLTDAVCAMGLWDGKSDPPGPWIRQKGSGQDRHNPLLYDHKGGTWYVRNQKSYAEVWTDYLATMKAPEQPEKPQDSR